MTAYDRNADGFLDARELDGCPSLKQALEKYDANGDGKLSRQEINDRLAMYRKGLARMPVVCAVLLDDNPLAGATVTFAPDAIMGSSAAAAEGVTDAQGTASLQTEDGDTEVALGLYRIKVSKLEGGRETIPARYNVNTVLGQEVAPDSRETTITVRITSR